MYVCVASYTGSWQAGRAWVAFEGEIFYELVKNTTFMEKTFTDCLLVALKDATLPYMIVISISDHFTHLCQALTPIGWDILPVT